MNAVMQQLQGVVWLGFIAVLVMALLSGFLRSRSFKGWWGERKVRRWLRQGLDPQKYHSLHNITLRLQDGSTTQIDHVVISPYGMFVLETKHFQGWIYGGEHQGTWTQSIYRHRSSFTSPLRQNWRHIKALEEVLNVPLQHLHSVVVFSRECSFKTPMPASVTQGQGCVAYIQSHQHVVWSTQEVIQWVQALSQIRLKANRATHQAHVENLRQRHAEPAIASKVLPSNGGKLAPRSKADSVRKEPSLAPAAMPVQPDEQAVDLANATAAASSCPDCGDGLVRRSLSDSQGTPRFFLRCVRFPHCRFVQSEVLEKV